VKIAELFATPLRIVVGLVSLAAAGSGGYYAWRYFNNRDAVAAVNAAPEIAHGKVVIASRKKTVARNKAALDSGIADFNAARDAARADTSTPPSTNACYDKGVDVITKCKKLQFSYDSLAAAQDTQITRLTDLAVSLRRGKLFALSAGLGYEPFWKAPAARAGLEINVSDRWSATGTVDAAAKIGRDSTTWRRAGFVGLNYHFGGRH
jgi:hypothetical protein